MLVLGISGSLRADSFNTALLRAAAGLLPPAARMALYTDLALVPPYSEDNDLEPAPAPVERLRAVIESADALLIATPEYNASIPGQLKNALDWASRPYPDNALRQKPVAVVGASTGVFGAVWAQAELRRVLATAGAHVLDDELPIANAYEAFDDNRTLADRDLSARLEHILANLLTRAVPHRPSSPRPPLMDPTSTGTRSSTSCTPSIRQRAWFPSCETSRATGGQCRVRPDASVAIASQPTRATDEIQRRGTSRWVSSQAWPLGRFSAVDNTSRPRPLLAGSSAGARPRSLPPLLA